MTVFQKLVFPSSPTLLSKSHLHLLQCIYILSVYYRERKKTIST